MANTMIKKLGGHVARALLVVFSFVFVLMGLPGVCLLQEPQTNMSDDGQGAYQSPVLGTVYASEEEEESEDYDLYTISTYASASLEDAMGGALTKEGEEDSSSEGDKEFEKGAPQAVSMLGDKGTHYKTGNVGTYLGYIDESKTKGKFKLSNIWQSKRTASSATFSYKQFSRVKSILFGTDDPNGKTNAYGFQSYANYGRTLADLGLDTTGSGGAAVRRMCGYAMMAAYLLASAIPFIFGYIAKFLSVLNPFVLLGEGANKLAESPSSLSELGKWTSNLWEILQDMSLFVIIPLFFAFSFGIALIAHQPGGGSKIGNSFFQFIVRLMFITIAIPITGAIYTSFLDQLSGLAGYGTNASDGVIYAELVDFQGWASKTRLAPPKGVQFEWNIDEGYAEIPDGSIRELALNVNKLAGHEPGDFKASKKGQSVPTTFGMFDLSKVEYTTSDGKRNLSESTAFELLKRYANGDVYSSSAYASEVNADRQALMTKSEKNYDKYKKMFLEGTVEGTEYPYTSHTDDDMNDNIYGNGRLSCATGDDGGVYTLSKDDPAGVAKKDNRVTQPGGLSTVAMYNYLNSKFDDSEITVYSSKKSTSEYVKDSHFSVSALGTGVWRILWFAQSFVTLLCMAIIGLIYAVSLIMTGFRQGGRMLVSIPGAALGSMAFIGRFCAAFFVMIADILITIVFYSIFCELLQVVCEATSNIIPTTTSTVVLNLGGTSMPFMIGFSPLNLLGVLFSIFLILYITWMAIRNRVVFIRSVDEVVSGSVGRMLGVKHGIGRGHKGSLMKAAAGTAAGVAAGHLISNKLDGAGKPDGGEGGAKGGGILGGDGEGGGIGPIGGLVSSATGGSADDGSGGAGGLGFLQSDADSASGGGTQAGGHGAFSNISGDGGMFGGGSDSAFGEGKMLGVDDLNNVDAETGAMSAGGVTETKSAIGSSTEGSGGAAAIAGRGGVVGSDSVNASKTAGGGGAAPRKASAGIPDMDTGGASTQSAGNMPDPANAKSAKFYEGANKVADNVMNTGAAAQSRDGFVAGMQSGAFKNGEFTGNAKALSGIAQNGAKAANFVNRYDNNTDAKWKEEHRGDYRAAKKQMAQSQAVLARAGVNGANSKQYMSPAQWNGVAKNIASSYSAHQQQNQAQTSGAPGRITGQRTQAPGRSAQPNAGGTPGRGGGRSRA